MIGRLGRTVAVSALTLAVMCGLWEGAIVAFNLSSFVAKGPVAVFDYLVTVPSAAADRSDLLSALWITLRDAAFGYVGGTITAVAVAVAVVWRKDYVAQTVMPVAIAVALSTFGGDEADPLPLSSARAYFPSSSSPGS